MARKASSLILFSVIFLVIAWIGPVGPALAAPQTAPRSAADLSLLGDWVNANPAIYYFVKSGSGFTGQIKGQTECPADLSEQATSTPGYYTGTE
jgi:hypothetical protein